MAKGLISDTQEDTRFMEQEQQSEKGHVQ